MSQEIEINTWGARRTKQCDNMTKLAHFEHAYKYNIILQNVLD